MSHDSRKRWCWERRDEIKKAADAGFLTDEEVAAEHAKLEGKCTS